LLLLGFLGWRVYQHNARVRWVREQAIPEISRFRMQSPVLTIIDAAIEDPEVLRVAVDALGSMGDGRARFFLERILHEGKPGMRERAAVSLSRLGESGRTILKSAIRSDSKEIRLAAIRALLPVATVDDLSSLYDYGRTHADDDPATAKAVEAATVALEKALESQRALDAASPSPR
jgi:HEAT repeat protein